MAIDIYIQPDVEVPRRGDDSKIIAQLEDDGLFHFLLPLFRELQTKTGQNIDLYEDAFFGYAQLNDLAETLAAAQQLLESQPKTWDVCVGTQTFPTHKKILRTVRRQDLQNLLDDIEAAAQKARAENLFITFWGD